MKALGVVVSMALSASVFGQAAYRGFGSVVFPGGTSATSPNITRSFGSVVFPGVARTQPLSFAAATPARRGNANFRRTPAIGRGTLVAPVYVYAFPVMVGGYDNSYAPQEQAPPPQEPAPEQPAVPVMIQVGPDGHYTTTAQHQTSTIYQPEPEPQPAVAQEPADPPHYLLAFKDHTIYSAVAYWADGDTLHYFTAGNVHNQASMSLIDRELTERLNRELGIDFTLPPRK